MVFTWILTYENLPKVLASTVFAITDNKFILLIVINIFLLIVDCLVDLTPTVIMLTQILMPLMQKMGMHIVHFGAMMIINLCYGLITPPVGTSLFVGLRISGLSMNQIIRPLLPLLTIEIVILIFGDLLAAAHHVAAPDLRLRHVRRWLGRDRQDHRRTPAPLCARVQGSSSRWQMSESWGCQSRRRGRITWPRRWASVLIVLPFLREMRVDPPAIK